MGDINEFIPCELCDEMVRFDNYQRHISECSLRAIPISLLTSTPRESSDTEDDEPEYEDPREQYENRLRQNHQISPGTSLTSFFNVYLGRSRNARTTHRMISEIRMSEYESNLALAERIGRVEIGVKDINIVGKVVDKALLTDTDICPVCQDQFFNKGDVRKLTCSHHFCDECISIWFTKNKKCPVCMHEFE